MSQSADDLTKTLDNLREQNRRMAKHQEASYKWHLQHHTNLKNVITALNRLGELLNEKLVGVDNGLVVQEDKDLLAVAQEPFSNNQMLTSLPPTHEPIHVPEATPNNYEVHRTPSTTMNLHQLVLKYQHNLHNEEFQNRLRNVNEEEFNTLQELSTEIILPLIASWLESQTSRMAGVIYLYESAMKFPQLFTRLTHRSLVKQFRDIVTRICSEPYDYGLSREELQMLVTFLTECYEHS
ncbi:hypothetical protein P9112_008586 [Eukaryota sp. TZLM1-RC]